MEEGRVEDCGLCSAPALPLSKWANMLGDEVALSVCELLGLNPKAFVHTFRDAAYCGVCQEFLLNAHFFTRTLAHLRRKVAQCRTKLIQAFLQNFRRSSKDESIFQLLETQAQRIEDPETVILPKTACAKKTFHFKLSKCGPLPRRPLPNAPLSTKALPPGRTTLVHSADPKLKSRETNILCVSAKAKSNSDGNRMYGPSTLEPQNRQDFHVKSTNSDSVPFNGSESEGSSTKHNTRTVGDGFEDDFSWAEDVAGEEIIECSEAQEDVDVRLSAAVKESEPGPKLKSPVNKRQISIVNKTGPYICEECGKSFPQKAMLTRHILQHEGTKQFLCAECGKGFLLQRYLKIHQATIHEGKRPYACPHCDKSYGSKSNLGMHMLNHAEVKPFPCTVCKKSFAVRSTLAIHARIHDGLKPFGCTECPATFSQSSNLKRHLSNHQELPETHLCSTCGKAFAWKGHLTSHMRSVHLKLRPYACLDCGIGFYGKSSLKKHMRGHVTGEEKSFGCTSCDKAFSRKSHLRHHEKAIHSAQD